ncbi:MAG: hypothetical protein LBG10_09875 [Treponema sp.]|jgi:hypothetical protein|nr:hypothetical protein [Treponema sp.]
MNYENLASDKKQIILDIAVKAISLRPGLAGKLPGKELPERIAEFAKILAESIPDPAIR